MKIKNKNVNEHKWSPEKQCVPKPNVKSNIIKYLYYNEIIINENLFIVCLFIISAEILGIYLLFDTNTK